MRMQGDDAKPPEKSLNYKDSVNVFVWDMLYAPPFSILWYSQAIFILLHLFSHSICTSALIYISGSYLFLLGVVFRSILENVRIKTVFSQTPYILLSMLLELATCSWVILHTRPISRKIRGRNNSDLVWSYLIWS